MSARQSFPGRGISWLARAGRLVWLALLCLVIAGPGSAQEIVRNEFGRPKFIPDDFLRGAGAGDDQAQQGQPHQPASASQPTDAASREGLPGTHTAGSLTRIRRDSSF